MIDIQTDHTNCIVAVLLMSQCMSELFFLKIPFQTSQFITFLIFIKQELYIYSILM